MTDELDTHFDSEGKLLSAISQPRKETTMTLPTKQESLYFRNAMGIDKPVPHDQKETDRKISEVVKRQAALDVKNAELRNEKTGEHTPKWELNRLRKELFDLIENAKTGEIRVNNEAGNVRLGEERLAATLKKKKECEDAGNLIGARSYEHSAAWMEDELLDTRERLVKEQRNNSHAIRALRLWKMENSARLEQMQKGIG